MTFLIQHGYGKSDKIESVTEEGNVAGVILSGGDEDIESLATTTHMCRRRGIDVLVDPQSYVYSTYPQGVGRKHEANGIQFANLHWSQGTHQTDRQIEAVGALNRSINPEGYWIAPTVLQSSFTDIWTPVAMQLARTASNSWGPDKTIATLAVSDAALENWSEIDEWLDVATTLEVKGFYILVARSNSTYPPTAWSPRSLSNLLRLIRSLSVFNGYQVTWGYSDSEGLLGLAAGASAISAGWSYTLRQFNPSKWQPSDSKGGRPPNPRINMSRLWSPLQVSPEALALFDSHLRETAFSDSEIRALTDRPMQALSRAELQIQYLTVLSKKAHLLSSTDLEERPDRCIASLKRALGRFEIIKNANILMSNSYERRLISLVDALEIFLREESL